MRFNRTTLNETLKDIADRLNLATTKEDAIKKKQTKYLYLEHNSIYGGYRVVNVHIEHGGHSGAFGGNGCEARLSAKAMYLKLDSILQGINATAMANFLK